MASEDEQHVIWERRQAELWDRIFQAVQDIVTLSEALDRSPAHNVVREQLIRSAMGVGAQLVRANAADNKSDFQQYVAGARLKAIETDYWLRLVYVLQQREDLQRDLSGVITQYAAIIDLLQKFARHTQREENVIARHTKGPRIS